MIRIQLLAPSTLLSSDVQALVSQHPDLAIVGVERDLERAIERAEELKPDVVIADGRVAGLDQILSSLQKQGLAPVAIAFDAIENRLRLYRSETWTVNDLEDLEQAIRAEPLLG